MIRVLFLCVHNSARSQLAEAWLRELGEGRYEVESAGLEPGRLNPHVVRALQEVGIDICGKIPQSVFDLHQAGRRYDWVVTVCSPEAAERCPIFPGGGHRLHWPLPDPASFTGSEEEVMARVRELREAVREKVREFVAQTRGGGIIPPPPGRAGT